MFHVSPPQWYGLIVALTVAIWLAFRSACLAFRLLLLPLALCLVKCSAALLRHLIPSRVISEIEIVSVVAYVAANAVCMGLYVNDPAEIAARSGILATVNLVPLLLGTHLSDVASFLKVTLRTQTTIHRWLGGMTLLEGLIHIVVLAVTTKLRWSALEICGTIVSLVP
jgi:hypothetical protein